MFEWHAAKDHLRGTEPLYGNFQNDPIAVGNFGRPFSMVEQTALHHRDQESLNFFEKKWPFR